MMKILDACCGSKMFWYNKNEPHTTYIDNREEKGEVKDREYIRTILVNPDIVADFRNMPFDDDTFDLVIFDPPHLIKAGDHSWLKMKYGVLPESDWQSYIKKGFDECMRVLKLLEHYCLSGQAIKLSSIKCLRLLVESQY